jgi:hypothetical protein
MVHDADESTIFIVRMAGTSRREGRRERGGDAQGAAHESRPAVASDSCALCRAPRCLDGWTAGAVHDGLASTTDTNMHEAVGPSTLSG